MPIVTNDLKKGDKVRLACGWDAVLADNMRGNTRLATVHGDYTEMGSVYSHDIKYLYEGSRKLDMETARISCTLVVVEHTKAQNDLRKRVGILGS